MGGRAKDTVFGLYRDGTELRGIYCGNPNTAVETCKLTGDDACEFPSMIGNDPYYGGLGECNRPSNRLNVLSDGDPPSATMCCVKKTPLSQPPECALTVDAA